MKRPSPASHDSPPASADFAGWQVNFHFAENLKEGLAVDDLRDLQELSVKQGISVDSTMLQAIKAGVQALKTKGSRAPQTATSHHSHTK